MTYGTVLIDPPWPQPMSGSYKRRKHARPDGLPYPTLTIDQILALHIEQYLHIGAHVYLWATNWFLHDAFHCLEEWGINYLNTITWLKPSGLGNYWIGRTEFLLMGYYRKCYFPMDRYLPNIIEAPRPARHSRKPAKSYRIIERVSPGPRIELFARPPHRAGWDVWGNEAIGTESCPPGQRPLYQEKESQNTDQSTEPTQGTDQPQNTAEPIERA